MKEAVHLTGLTRDELERFVQESGEPAYRGRQIFGALHRRRLRSFEEMTDLPKDFRERLATSATASTLTIESRYVAEDGTRRYLMKTRDGLPVETVFIPEERRDTICFSSRSRPPASCRR
jgi:23S rRNA (adenine2503-C2)-methyltransferase